MATMSVPRAHLRKIVAGFPHATVMVIGDAMLDEYIRGVAERISPEAPVPVVEVESQETKLGGAANVACNLKSLGVTPHLVALCGADGNGERLRGLLHQFDMSSEGLFVSRRRHTTAKTRIVAGHQQIVRADRETRQALDDEEYRLLYAHVEALIGDVDAVVLSDYAKGVLVPSFVQAIISLCRENKVFVAVDPKLRDFGVYAGANVVTPNLREAQDALYHSHQPYTIDEVREMGWQLVDRFELACLLITLGQDGMGLFEARRRVFSHLPATEQKVYDVTGAGDTVVSVFTAASACGAKPSEAAWLANCAAALTVMQLGTAVTDTATLLEVCARGQRAEEVKETKARPRTKRRT